MRDFKYMTLQALIRKLKEVYQLAVFHQTILQLMVEWTEL